MLGNNTLKKSEEHAVHNGHLKIIGALLIFSSILIVIVLSGSAKAYERPEFKDGLADKWHPGNFCIPCHYSLMSKEKAQAISSGCKCHDYKPKDAVGKYKVDMTKIFDIHKDIVCIRCHVGIKNQENVTAMDFHRIMSNTPCLSCHTFVNNTYQKPQKTNCSDCHGGDPHVVHGNRLEKMCVACHGEFGENYTNKTIEISGKMNTPSIVETEAINTGEYPTIAEFLSRIFKSIAQVIK